MATLKRKKGLAKKAEENTTITKKTVDGTEHIKKGVPLDHSNKHDPKSGTIIGMSKGVTKNMDNYESLRVDVWLSDTVQEGETPESAAQRIESFIDATLEQAIRNCIEE